MQAQRSTSFFDGLICLLFARFTAHFRLVLARLVVGQGIGSKSQNNRQNVAILQQYGSSWQGRSNTTTGHSLHFKPDALSWRSGYLIYAHNTNQFHRTEPKMNFISSKSLSIIQNTKICTISVKPPEAVVKTKKSFIFMCILGS